MAVSTYNYVRGQVVNLHVSLSTSDTGWRGDLPGGLSCTSVWTGGILDCGVTGTLNCPPRAYETNFAIFAITDPNPLDPPVITCATATTINGVQTVTVPAGPIAVQLAASNSGSNWTGAFASGLNINSYGLIAGTLGPGTYNLTGQASNYAWSQNDYTHGSTQSATYPFVLIVVPALPVLSITGNGFGGNYTVGDDMPNAAVFSVQNYALPVTWSATGLPDGVSINPTTGYVTGKMTEAGSYNVTITATNSTGAGTFAQTIIVAPEQNVPVVTLATEQPGYAGQTDNYNSQRQLTFAVGKAVTVYFDATHNPTSWTATDLPSGLEIDAQTGIVTGLLRVPGSYRFFVTATNGVGDSEALAVTVTATGTALAFEFISADPTLCDVQINGRDGTATFGRSTPFKLGERARFALIWLDYGSPVAPPDVEGVKIGIRVKDQYAADYVLPKPGIQLVAAVSGQPAYLLVEFAMFSDDLEKELVAAVTNNTLPLALMADVRWATGEIDRVSQTFTFSVSPTVTY